MTGKSKISLEQLEKELDKNKTVKEIAEEYNYSYPSRALSNKLRELGYSKNYSLTARSDRGGYNIYLKENPVLQALETRKLDDENDVYYYYNIKERGIIEIITTHKMWTKKQ